MHVGEPLTSTQVSPGLVHLPLQASLTQAPLVHIWPAAQAGQGVAHAPALQYWPLAHLTPAQGSGWQVAGEPVHTCPVGQLVLVH